ncbi:MAG: 50S ribosomal protein L13 [Oligoflexia bacterium]|nr:50S ribosomal protein L13 [Oligoflexia bacterium]
MLIQKSYVLKPNEAQKKWHLINAENLVLGRLATEVANLLRGKNRPTYTNHTDSGDFVIVTNCEKVKLTGKKIDKKIYYWHTNHIGGIKERTAKEQLERHPEMLVYEAVKGMLPKNTLGREQLKKLKIFVGEKHDHEAQKPEVYELKQ